MPPAKLFHAYFCVPLAFIFLHSAWSQRNCGRSLTSPPPEGSTVAPQGAWPWMVAIVKPNRAGEESYLCTGFLIDRKHVVSSAHCFQGNHSTSLYSARIGDVDFTLGDVYSVSHIAIHEGFKRNEFYDDVALLTLSEEVDSPDFSPVCLSGTLGNLTGSGATVVSWGATRMLGPLSKSLKQFGGMTVVSDQMCNSVYGNFKRVLPRGITSGMICSAFLTESTEGLCYGSAGSPLMVERQGRWYAVGITSFGYQCGRPEYPDVYTKISEYLTWIDQNKN